MSQQSTAENRYTPPPIKGLAHIIAKWVVEDYRRELAQGETDESRNIRTLQHR